MNLLTCSDIMVITIYPKEDCHFLYASVVLKPKSRVTGLMIYKLGTGKIVLRE